MTLFEPGSREGLKGVVHTILLLCAIVCAVYNAVAWLRRRERHLGVNAWMYLGLTAVEWAHVRHHWRG